MMYGKNELRKLMLSLGLSFSYKIDSSDEEAPKYTATLFFHNKALLSIDTGYAIFYCKGEEKYRQTFALIFERSEHQIVYKYEDELKAHLSEANIEEIKLYTWGYKYSVKVCNFNGDFLGGMSLFVKNRKEAEAILTKLNAQYESEKVMLVYNYMEYLKGGKYWYNERSKYLI
jgi:hypothetical protein